MRPEKAPAIVQVRSASKEEWDVTWTSCPYATYFHGRQWAETWEVYTDGRLRPEPRVLLFSDGVSVLLPLTLEVKKGLFKRYHSSPAGTFGGWISEQPLGLSHARPLVDYLRSLGNLIWRLNPYDEVALQVCPPHAIPDETQAIPLSLGFEKIFRSWTKGHRSAVKKARREGIRIKEGTSSEEWSTYYGIYEASLERWGESSSSRYRRELFDGLFKVRTPYVKLWLALLQETPVAGALCLYSPRHVVYWHGGALQEYFRLRAVNLLIHDIIQDACERGYSWFDFNPSGGHEGVKAFKKSFGAMALMSPTVTQESTAVRTLRGLSQLRLRGMFSRSGKGA